MWTLEGVHMLGFFIKSERAKTFRKFTAELLAEIKRGNAKVVSQKDVDAITRGYKSQIVQKNNKIALLEAELAKLKNQLPAPATDLDELHVKILEANRMILEGTRHQLNAALESIITVRKRRDKT